ncbi:SCP2 sterol-binding domain-containing protein [Wukongibacter baidiensis]|uniref:SCP2 sterol-binding domain-containing protein n=1 Tax=Wukongibacter baidiensis TaxID=1723361 RepID=UPI003D7FB55F
MNMNQLTNKEIKEIAKACGAADAGIISIAELPEDQQDNVKKIFPTAESIISIAVNYNQNAIRSQFQPVGNMEFRSAYKSRDNICRDIERKLMEKDIGTVAITETFPIDLTMNTPWLISHKDIAVKAGIGAKGLNRIVLHKKYGASIVLGSILIDMKLDEYDRESTYDPCINCNLCKAVCPTGAIEKDDFDFFGCYNHNYRDRGNSFKDILNRLEKGNGGLEKITDDEKNTLWASIQEGYGFRCNRCVAVCPAAEREVDPFKADRKAFYNTYVKPFIDKEETIFVQKGSKSEAFVDKNPAKTKKYVGKLMSIDTINFFKRGLTMVFNKEKAKDIKRTYQFIFTGSENEAFTVKVEEGKLSVYDGIAQDRDVLVKADSELWLKFLENEKILLKGILTRKIRIKGNPKYLKEFGTLFKV